MNWFREKPQQRGWEPCNVIFRKPTATGTIVGWAMRRGLPDGTWEYREMTDAEALDWLARTAW